MKNILVTGGLGFIGSNFIRMLLKSGEFNRVINFDKQTYAGNPENLQDLEKRIHIILSKQIFATGIPCFRHWKITKLMQ